MKFNNHSALAKLLPLGFLLAISTAQAQQPKAVPTQWPEIKAEVAEITRLVDNRVAVRFTFTSSAAAPAETLIADKVFPALDEWAREAYESSGPYSIDGATLIDEATGKSYPASDRRPDESRPGRSYKKIALPPSSGFVIGLILECPPPNADDPPKKQVVSFQLPGVTVPIAGVPLPREVNQTVTLRKAQPPKSGE